MKPLIFRSTFAIALLLVAFEAFSNTTQLEQDAAAFCRAFSDTIEDTSGSVNSVQHWFAVAAGEVEKNVKSEKIRSLISEVDALTPEEFYKSTTSKMSSILERDWNCPSFEKAFLPNSTVIVFNQLSIKTVTPSKNEMIILSVNQDGHYFVNEMPLASNNEKTLIAAIKLIVGGNDLKDTAIYIHVDGAVNFEKVAKTLAILERLEIKEAGFIY